MNSTATAQFNAPGLVVPFLDLKAQYESIREEIREVVLRVMDSCQFVGGHWVEEFESAFASYLGARSVIAVGSGTAALELALKAASIRPGDEVIVPANSFIATAEAVSNVGATPVFCDVNPRTFHLDASSAESVLTERTRAIIAVHLYGRGMDLSDLEQIAARHNLRLIEDAAQAHGVSKSGIKVGRSGRLTCFSFYPGKNLGAFGDAGAVACGDEAEARLLRLLRDHGSPSKYQHTVVGTNSRLDSIQAAVLCVKLRYLDHWNSLRVRHAKLLARGLKRTEVIPPEIPTDGEHNFHLFVLRSRRREDLRRFLQQKGIQTGIHYPIPIHLTEAYRSLNSSRAVKLPVSEELSSEILSLPMYPELSAAQTDYIMAAFHEFSESSVVKVPEEASRKDA